MIDDISQVLNSFTKLGQLALCLDDDRIRVSSRSKCVTCQIKKKYSWSVMIIFSAVILPEKPKKWSTCRNVFVFLLTIVSTSVTTPSLIRGLDIHRSRSRGSSCRCDVVSWDVLRNKKNWTKLDLTFSTWILKGISENLIMSDGFMVLFSVSKDLDHEDGWYLCQSLFNELKYQILPKLDRLDISKRNLVQNTFSW